MQNVGKASSQFNNVAFQTSIKHLKIISLLVCLICKSGAILKRSSEFYPRSILYINREEYDYNINYTSEFLNFLIILINC